MNNQTNSARRLTQEQIDAMTDYVVARLLAEESFSICAEMFARLFNLTPPFYNEWIQHLEERYPVDASPFSSRVVYVYDDDEPADLIYFKRIGGRYSD